MENEKFDNGWKNSGNKGFTIITIDLCIKCVNSTRTCGKRH